MTRTLAFLLALLVGPSMDARASVVQALKTELPMNFLVPAIYICSSVGEPTISKDPCGFEVCRYPVGCTKPGGDRFVRGEAYCPLNQGKCAPFHKCMPGGENTAPEMEDYLRRECQNFQRREQSREGRSS